MILTFSKYHGTGNDFVMVDNRTDFFPKENKQLIANLCHRRFGIGGDGLILIENATDCDFNMVYYNSDGAESTMCGNGGRCLVAFAKQLGIIESKAVFRAVDGWHTATIDEQNQVALQMIDVSEVRTKDASFFLNTGSPHHVELVADVKNIDVYNLGKTIRESDVYAPGGTNVNFVQQLNPNTFKIRTFERGVEAETLSCGTGATAVALAMYTAKHTASSSVQIQVEGGDLRVDFEYGNQGFKQVYLTGPATFVFQGNVEISLS